MSLLTLVWLVIGFGVAAVLCIVAAIILFTRWQRTRRCNMSRKEDIRSQLSILKEANPDFPWPEQGERRNYPKELGGCIGGIRRFGFLQRNYKLLFRTSNERSAIERVKELAIEGKKSLITYNPIRLETYGVWSRTC